MMVYEITNRSSFLGVKMERWSGEKKEIVIEDCEPEVLDIVVNYMYGIEIPNQVLTVNGSFRSF